MSKKNKNKGKKKMGQCYVVKKSVSEDSWEVKIDTVSDCSKSPDNVVIWVKPIAKAKIDALMEEYPNIEWLAYLIGENNIVEDIFVPNQVVTATSVNNIRCSEFNDIKCIGVIHSHHGMGNGFSGTDHEWINQNHNISLCISKSGIAGQVRWTTPCGCLKIVPAITKLKLDVDFDKDGFVEAAKSKIEEKRYSTSTSTGLPIVVGWEEEDDSTEELNFDEERTLEEELVLLEEMGMEEDNQ